MKKETKENLANKYFGSAGGELSPYDDRDYKYEHLYRVTSMPVKVDHAPDMLGIYSQLPGQCTPFAVRSIKNFQEYKSIGLTGSLASAFLWERRHIIHENQKGMFVRDALNILREEGIPTLFSYTHDTIKKIAQQALNFRIRAYAKVETQYGLRQALLQNGPCVCVLPVYDFSNTFWKQSMEERIVSFHTVAIVGYDDEWRTFKIRNSWGSGWSNAGYGYLSYDDFKLIYECWTILDDSSARLAGIRYKDNSLWLKVKIWLWRYYMKHLKK